MSALASLLSLDPIPTLLTRVRTELAADFGGKPIRVARAPGRLDVMGGIADYTGSLVCEATLDRAAAVALTPREDRDVQVFSFNLYDDHKPFTLRIPLHALATQSAEALRREFNQPGRRWAGYLAGCLFVLHEQKYVDLADPAIRGMNLALFSTIPPGAGVSSSAAIEVATMLAVCDHLGIGRSDDEVGASAGAARDENLSSPAQTVGPLRLAALCQSVENRIVGAPCGIMDQVASCYGQADALLRMKCQPHELLPPLSLPPGMRVLGIDSGVRHSVGGQGGDGAPAGPGQYARTRCAAFMGHAIILDRMRQIGAAGGQTLTADPMGGYLANLDPDDYKRIFRPSLPERIKGGQFLLQFGRTIDPATTVELDYHYRVMHACDHHVLEARRVRRFIEFLEQATPLPPHSRERGLLLDKAGHLMYASHQSYTHDAMLGHEACDLLVQLLREREPAGIYGAKITGGGQGGTIALLAEATPRVDAAIAEVLAEYAKMTGNQPAAFHGSSPGAWHTGTMRIASD